MNGGFIATSEIRSNTRSSVVKKMKGIRSNIALAAAAAAVLTFSTAGSQNAAAAVAKNLAASAPVATLRNESVVRLPIEIPYSLIEELVNEKAPLAASDHVNNPTSALSEDSLYWHMKRGHITVSRGNNCIVVSVPVSGHATAKGKLGIKKKSFLGFIPLRIPVQETAHFSGVVNGCVTFDIAPDWTLVPKVSLDLDLKKAEVRLANAVPVSFRGLAEKEFNKQKGKIIRDVTDAVVSGMAVKAQVQKGWDSLNAVYKVSADPEVYARVASSRVIFQPLTFDKLDAVTVGVGLVAEIGTFVGVKPPVATPKPLPPIEPVAELAGNSELRVPVVVNLDAVNEVLEKKLSAEPVDVEEGKKLSITSARLASRNGRALLTLGYEIERAWYLPDASGTIDIEARPVLDSDKQTLAFRELDYSVSTRSRLVNAAAWLLKPVVLKAIESRASVELAPHLANARASANEQVKLLTSKGGLASAPSVDKLRIDKVVIHRDALIAVVGSELSTHIELAAARY
jgi:hypothetical protein